MRPPAHASFQKHKVSAQSRESLLRKLHPPQEVLEAGVGGGKPLPVDVLPHPKVAGYSSLRFLQIPAVK